MTTPYQARQQALARAAVAARRQREERAGALTDPTLPPYEVPTFEDFEREERRPRRRRNDA